VTASRAKSVTTSPSFTIASTLRRLAAPAKGLVAITDSFGLLDGRLGRSLGCAVAAFAGTSAPDWVALGFNRSRSEGPRLRPGPTAGTGRKTTVPREREEP
jgi:hypothetical protein